MHLQWKEILSATRSTLQKQWPAYLPGYGEDALRESGFIAVPRADSTIAVYYKHIEDDHIGYTSLGALQRDRLAAYGQALKEKMPFIKTEVQEPSVERGYWWLQCVFPARVVVKRPKAVGQR